MEENTQEKNLLKKKENFFSKVKNFFKNLFKKNKQEISANSSNETSEENNNFKENIKIVESEEDKLIDLQRRYRRGEVAESDLTEEQIDALSKLYDKQIEILKIMLEEKKRAIAKNNKN